MMTAHVVIKAYNEEHPSTLDGRPYRFCGDNTATLA